MREAARIAPRCHPIAQIRQPLAPVRLWAVEAASARPTDIFSLLLMPAAEAAHPSSWGTNIDAWLSTSVVSSLSVSATRAHNFDGERYVYKVHRYSKRNDSDRLKLEYGQYTARTIIIHAGKVQP